MTPKLHCNVYVASCHQDGGIVHYQLTADGTLVRRGKAALDRVQYMALAGNRLYAVLRSPFPRSTTSGVAVLAVLGDGSLRLCGEILPTHGTVGCHIGVGQNPEELYVANYGSGSVVKLPGTVVTHTERGTHPQRQQTAHPHQVVVAPDGAYLCVPDLGADQIYIYDRMLQRCGAATVPQGHGPRHVAFSPDGRMFCCVNELQSTISLFRYHSPALEYVSTTSMLPFPQRRASTAAAIRFSPDGRYVFASNRGADSISCFALESETLRLLGATDCGGRTPRDFVLTPDGTTMIVANQDSDSLAIFSVKKGVLQLVGRDDPIKNPVCICVMGGEGVQ